MQNETKNNRSSKRFGKLGLLIAFILLSTIGTALLLTTYGTVTGTADVEQGVTVDGDTTYIIGDSPAQAGNTYLDGAFTVKNNAEVPALITLDTRCYNNRLGYDDGTPTNMSIDWSSVGYSNKECDGIVTSYFGSLNLTKKQIGTWQAIGDPITITYTLTGDDFVINEVPPTGYVFVYAMDQDNRFVDYATVMRVEHVDESLPMVGDWNADASPDYCDNNNEEGDYYTHCVGAKIWAVPEIAIIGNECDENDFCPVAWGGMENFWWETDLIAYTKGADNKITLPANGGGFDFVVENALDVALTPDVYTLTTNISPA